MDVALVEQPRTPCQLRTICGSGRPSPPRRASDRGFVDSVFDSQQSRCRAARYPVATACELRDGSQRPNDACHRGRLSADERDNGHDSAIVTSAKTVTLPPSAWQGAGVVQGDALYLEKPPTGQWVNDNLQPTITAQPVNGIVGGVRYRWSMKCKEEDYLAYEATKWAIELELLDAKGKVVARRQTNHGQPDPLRLSAPSSNTPTHDWAETVQYFDAPAAAGACPASFARI